uniref:GW182 middle domain-containing protein n=1 Tax=Ascaris lumbricoides TaxID=6252 RepID=A0A9J2PD83_ASCLU
MLFGAATNHSRLTNHPLTPMWLLNENSQTAETTSLNPWTVEQQQSRWCGGTEFGNGMSYEEQMRSIIPPAFRNANAKVVWQDSSKSLEANVNEALGITNWPATTNNQFSEQDSANGSSQYQAAFMNGMPAGWGQAEIDQQRPWDVGVPVTPSSQGVRNVPGLCPSALQPKWPTNEDRPWNGGMQRLPALPCGPPPNYMNTRNGGWQHSGPRGSLYTHPGARFNGSSFDVSVAGNWDQRTVNGMVQQGMPPATVPPPQRSRLQNVWASNVPMNATAPGICMPPPNVDYVGGVAQWAPGSSMAAPGPVKQPFTHVYSSRSSPPMSVGTFNAVPAHNTNSFMGEDSMWQDPNGDVRKWQRDTGTAIWGDPDKQPTEIRRWLVPPGAEYDSVSETKAGDDSDSPHDSKGEKAAGKAGRVIVPMGWGDVPPASSIRSANSSNSVVSSSGNVTPWANHASNVNHSNSIPGWDGRSTFKPNVPGWEPMSDVQSAQWSSHPFGGASSPSANSPDAGMPIATQLIADQLRTAVSKGLIDFSLLSKPLPHETLSLINALLLRLPVLDQTEHELASLLAAVKLNAGNDAALCGTTSPTALMNAEQRAEHDRLVIEIAATKTDIAVIREKIHATQEAASAKPAAMSSDAATTVTPRFGDSILDVTAGVEPQKPLFSIF